MYLNEMKDAAKHGKYGWMIRIAGWMGKLKDIPEILYLFAFKKRGNTLSKFCQEVMRGPGPLDFATRELIFAFGSVRNGCKFCGDSHVAAAQAFEPEQFPGWSEFVSNVCRNFESCTVASLGPKLTGLLTFCDKVRTRQPITQDDHDSLRALGWTTEEVHDTITIVCLHSFFNRWVDAHGVAEMTPEQYQQSGQMLKKGYN